MSYLVLARKYRPRTFSEVTGQEVVTRTLQGAIAEGRIGHAYLFSGPRGTGKTTTARIFARALNCERGPAPDPCGECERCRAAESGAELDLVEIDAASNTSVEDVRSLREQAAYAPLRARYKIYLVDEVHMLSKSAFNALLKTLEEPPAHVKFLFATTELHKLPDTIVSRCQVLKLAPLSEATIGARLREVFDAEEVKAGPGVVEELARRARGGMRDALSLADQLLAMAGEEPELDDLRRLSATADHEQLGTILSHVRAGDRAAVLESLPATQGGEAELLDGLLDHLRSAMVLAHCGGDSQLVEAPEEARERMAAFARDLGPERLELWLEELLAARVRMREIPTQARLVLELALFGLARPEATVPLAELVERLLALEVEVRTGSAPSTPSAPARSAREPQALRAAPERDPPQAGGREAILPAQRTQRRPPAASARVLRSSSAETWRGFLDALAQSAPSLSEVLARSGRLVELGGGRAVVRLENLRAVDGGLIGDPRNQRRCSQALSSLLGEPYEVELVDSAGLRPGRDDPFTREVADLFGGRIED